MNGNRAFARFALTVAAILGGLIVAAAPANAATPAGTADSGVITPLAPSGGGCANTRAIGSCISFASGTVNPLLGDFYLNYSESGSAIARVWIVVNGSERYKYTTILDHLGHYPIARHTVSGSGSAFTRVRIYNSNDSYLYTADSKIQYW